MPSPEPLCEYCSKILRSRHGDSLGSGKRIMSSGCPLCQMVVRAFQTLCQSEAEPSTGMELSKKSEVKLHWFGGTSGPGGRGAFTIDPAGLQIWICKAASAQSQVLSVKDQYLKPKIGAEFDVRRLSEWISTCTRAHSGLCKVEASSFGRSLPGLGVVRFIDVELAAIVELRTVPKYVALSYVWGEVATMRLTTINRPSLLLPGGIRKGWSRVPRTVRDAIDLVRRLKVQYLWVDALCLIQNDPMDMECGVDIMDEIYERSWLTIIAAYGHNANAGLPGIQEGSRSVQTATRITDDISMGLHVPLDRLLKRSAYNSRAWTFQEQLLARRAVYFVENQVYFRCREDVYAEQLVDQRPRGGEPVYLNNDILSSMLPSTTAMDEPFRDFEIMLMYYTRKALTNQSDILRAMAGVIRRLSEKAKCRFLEGLPTAVFDAFIVFKAHNWVLRRREGFPSYSWTGWRGGIKVLDGVGFETLSKWLEEETWIIWYKRSPSGVLNLVWDLAANEAFPLNDPRYHGYRRQRSFKAPAQLQISSSRTRPSEDLPPKILTPRYHLLQFWTLSIHFKLEIADIFAGTAIILTTQGTPAGTIYLDGFEEDIFCASQIPFEFILLSGARKNMNMESSTYFIMLLEWNGGIAERRGLGFIEKAAVIHSFPPGPKWKEIVLG